MDASATQQAADKSAGALPEIAGKYLTFKLDAEEYGLEILKVQEIIKMLDVTRVPRTPGFVSGVINLRGKIIPVIDLRLKFGMESLQRTEKTCIIVVQVAHTGDPLTMGVVVDEVSEVLDIAAEEIEPTPPLGAKVDTTFILGMAKAKGGVKILLDIDKALSPDEVQVVSALEKESAQG